MKPLILLCLLACNVFLSGCVHTLNSKVAVFRVNELVQGSVVIVPGESVDGESLEFAHYAQQLAAELMRLGFHTVQSAPADYTAVLSYAVAEVSPDELSLKAGYWLRSGYTVLPGSPLFYDAVVIKNNDKRRQYKRTVALHLQSNSSKKRVYEAVASSIGSCDVMTVVFDEMLQAIISGYPQPNGSVQSVRIAGDLRC